MSIVNERQNDGNKIQILQVLRAIAAVIVFLCHYFSEGYTLYGVDFAGAVGVGIFFVISGFLLIYTDKGNYKGYLVKRLIRICPLYWLMTLMVFVMGLFAPSLLHTSVSTIPNLLKSLVFIPYYSADGFFPMLPIGWTLIVEMFVYLLYYIVARCVQFAYRSKLKKSSSVVNTDFVSNPNVGSAGGIIVASILLILVVLNHFAPKNLFLFSYGADYMIFFIIGLIGAIIMKSSKEAFKELKNKFAILQKASLFICLFLFAAFIGFSTVYSTTILNILILGFLVFAAIFSFWHVSFPKIIVFFGDISYSFYLIHYFIVKLCTRLFMKSMLANNVFCSIVLPVVCFAVTALLAWISYELIEKRLANKLRSFI